MRLEEKNWKKIEYVIRGVLLCLLAYLIFFLTYCQAVSALQDGNLYKSDILAYMKEAQGIDSGYQFPYPIMFWGMSFFHIFFSMECASALVITIFSCASFLILRHYFAAYLSKACPNAHTGWQQVLVTVTAFCILFYSMIFVYNHYFPGTRFYYLGVFTPNPFHNATYVSARPFCIVTTFLFADLLEQYEARFDVKKSVLFSAILLLATMTKPSFTIVFCGAAGLIMLWRMLRSKFKNFKNTILLGCMFIPTFVDLLYQFGGVFTGQNSKGEDTGIGFSLFKVWGEYCDNYIMAIVLLIFFPIVVYCFQHRKIRTNTLYRFGWQMYGMGLAMFILLYEKGFRAADANFSWGYMIGAFFLVMVSLLVLLEETAAGSKKDWKLWVQWAAFGIHLVCGVFYFAMIFMGGFYY